MMAAESPEIEATTPPPERILDDGGLVGVDTARNFVLNTRPLFKLMVEKKASDLFFSSNAPIKINQLATSMPGDTRLRFIGFSPLAKPPNGRGEPWIAEHSLQLVPQW